MTRRRFIEIAGAVAAISAFRKAFVSSDNAIKVGMCDWNLGRAGRVDAFELAAKIGLDGVEVSIHFPSPTGHLRNPDVQKQFIEASKKHGVEIASTALGVLNSVPLKSEPKAAIWVADAIEVTRNLGTKVILLAFFGRGELRPENKEEMSRVIDVLKELAPRAERAGVILGLENTLSAEDNLRIVEQVGSKAVQVYYDLKNSADRGRDVPKEIRMLKGLICQVHLKNGPRLLSEPSNVDFPKCAEALREIGYDGWYILETSSPRDIFQDTRANIEYTRKAFGSVV
ncbi:MAG: sugar phosphate isomerase/epimerase family protein [Armatimonadota bacterium]|nr:sugar phosphate isomerase/epimerase [Armatimonadota bacterium]MCX7776510.1 sugar phosphate isomerase/epimerase [Armatimonadota bacterium]MDW8024307.1 sugar phosphate isomerase/epimerase family protein [Armatimonadota bacterium]